jgi:hypothetical protein
VITSVPSFCDFSISLPIASIISGGGYALTFSLDLTIDMNFIGSPCFRVRGGNPFPASNVTTNGRRRDRHPGGVFLAGAAQ